MLKKTLLQLLLLSVYICVHAQQKVHLSGRIINKQTKEVIAHALINISDQHTLLSNHQGQYSITDLPAGRVNLEVSHMAYQSKKLSLELQSDSIIDIYLTQKSIGISQVEVHAGAAAMNSEAINARLRKESQGKTLADVLSDKAGVSVLRTGQSIAKPMINGLFGNRIILVNNGTKHESQQWGLDHAPEIDPFSSQKISIVKSAEAIRYGASALGGLVLLEQSPIADDKKIAGSVNLGFHSNSKGGYLNSQLEGTLSSLSYRAGISSLKAGNIKTPDYYIGNTGKQEISGNLFLKYAKNKHALELYASSFNTQLGIFFGAHAGNKEDILARIKYGRPFEDYDFSYAIAAPKQKTEHQLATVSYHYALSPSKSIEAQYSIQQNHRREYDMRRVESDNTPMSDMVLTSQQLQAILKSNHSMLGISGSTQVNNNTAGTGTTPIIPNYDNSNIALFFSHKIPYGPNQLELAGRYDYNFFDAAGYRYAYNKPNEDGSISQYLLQDSRNFNSFSGLVSSSWILSPVFSWKSSVSLAWRAPSASELYADGIHHGTGTYEVGDIDLKSEKGLKWVNTLSLTKNWLNLKADIYGQYIHQYIYSQPNVDSLRQTIRGTFPVFQYKQDNALFYGLDLQAAAKISSKLDYQLTFSSTRAKNISKKQYLPYIPADRFTHALSYNFNNKNASYIKLKHLYQARQNRYESNSDFAAPPASYHTFDLLASTSFHVHAGQQLHLLVSMENLLNKRYKDYLNRFRYYSHSMGRNTSLKINYTF